MSGVQMTRIKKMLSKSMDEWYNGSYSVDTKIKQLGQFFKSFPSCRHEISKQ